MAEGICSITDCGGVVKHRGWCGSHYKRWYKYGDPLVSRQRLQQFTDTEKLCSACQQWKPLAEFSPSRRNRSGKQSYCRSCQATRVRRSLADRSQEQVAAAAERRRRRTIETYGLSVGQYDAMLAAQSGGCAVCGGDPQGRWRQPHIDHDHATGKVRGILCHPCNTALGLASEDPARLRALADYLER